MCSLEIMISDEGVRKTVVLEETSGRGKRYLVSKK